MVIYYGAQRLNVLYLGYGRSRGGLESQAYLLEGSTTRPRLESELQPGDVE